MLIEINKVYTFAITPSSVAYLPNLSLNPMSQTVAIQTASPRALRSRNRTSRLDAHSIPVTTRASSSQPFEDALTGEEEQDEQNEEEEDRSLEFPQSNQNALNRHDLEFDQNNRLRRADPNRTPTNFPSRPVNRTQVEVQFDENDPDTFLERLTASGRGRRSRRAQSSQPPPDAQTQTNDLDTTPKRYNLRAQSSSASNVDGKKKTASHKISRLFRGPIGSEDEEEMEIESEESEESEEEEIRRNIEEQRKGGEGIEQANSIQENEEDGNEEVEDEDIQMQEGGVNQEEEGIEEPVQRDQPQLSHSSEREGAGIEDEEEVDELEEAEDEEAVAATLEPQRASTSQSNNEEDTEDNNDDDYQEFPDDNDDDDDFEEDLDEETVQKHKAKTLKRRQSRREEQNSPAKRIQQPEEPDEEESEIADDESERGAQNSPAVAKYRYTIGQNNVGRKKWTDEETDCLMSAMNSVMTGEDAKLKLRPYFAVLQLHGDKGSIDNLLASRNNMQLKDKVRNEILRRKRGGIQVPEWAERLFRTI